MDLAGEGVVDGTRMQRSLLVWLVLGHWANRKQAPGVEVGWGAVVVWVSRGRGLRCGQEARSLGVSVQEAVPSGGPKERDLRRQ